MRTTQMFTFAAATVLLAAAGCNQGGDGGTQVAAPRMADAPPPRQQTTPTGPATPSRGAVLQLAQHAESGGTYLTDSAGNALYAIEGETQGEKCTGACLEAWPPLLVGDVQPSAGAGAQASLVATVPRDDGTSQVTYDGQPLYRYAADTGAGRTAGQGVEDQWGQWHLVTADGSPLQESSQPQDPGS